MFDVPSFKISKNDHIIDVQQFDDIDFVCPYYPAVTSRSHRRRHRHHEYYVIYRRVRSHVTSRLSLCVCVCVCVLRQLSLLPLEGRGMSSS